MARGGLALAAAGFIGAAIAFDMLTLIVASLLLGAGLGAVYAPSTAALANAPPPQGAANLLAADVESTLDGCEVEAENLTPDEDLPAAEGGVA